MNTSFGWVKLYRCLLDDPLWQCSTNEQKIILVTLLLMANHAEAKWQWQGRPYHCQPGQMITSAQSIAKKAGPNISRQNVRTALKRLEKMEFLTIRTTRHHTLVTIFNWERYQANPEAVNQPANPEPTNMSPTPNHRLTTNKNEKNLSLREDISFTDFNDDNDTLLQETLRIAQEYDDEQKRICQMLQRTNPETMAPLDAEPG